MEVLRSILSLTNNGVGHPNLRGSHVQLSAEKLLSLLELENISRGSPNVKPLGKSSKNKLATLAYSSKQAKVCTLKRRAK